MLIDFVFDGVSASEMGLVIGGIDGVSDSDSLGNKLAPVIYKPSRSHRHRMAASAYEEPYTKTFKVMRDPCSSTDPNPVFTEIQLNRILSWLIREEGYHKLVPIYDDGQYSNVYYMGYFKVTSESGFGGISGLKLEFVADSPYAYQEFSQIPIQSGDTFVDVSDKSGYLYADLDIVVKEAGDLKIWNSIDPTNTVVILDVLAGDHFILHGDSKIIESERQFPGLYNNFNYNFLRICNTFSDKNNTITSSLSCDLKLTYTPVRRVGISL
ncbi:phage tail domain-containing protein [Ileibacterium valens]|uniref:phage tail domain-containing protein n=1 Tax=Ileibacterium valens TaxID=1862668 RepID=UPI0027311D76|nr:phage tail domain-containing protein [Ileibacterium valens]